MVRCQPYILSLHPAIEEVEVNLVCISFPRLFSSILVIHSCCPLLLFLPCIHFFHVSSVSLFLTFSLSLVDMFSVHPALYLSIHRRFNFKSYVTLSFHSHIFSFPFLMSSIHPLCFTLLIFSFTVLHPFHLILGCFLIFFQFIPHSSFVFKHRSFLMFPSSSCSSLVLPSFYPHTLVFLVLPCIFYWLIFFPAL